MKFNSSLMVWTFSMTSLLTACNQAANQVAVHKAYCNELKSEMIFNGATSNTRNAEIQRSEAPLEKRTYDIDC